MSDEDTEMLVLTGPALQAIRTHLAAMTTDDPGTTQEDRLSAALDIALIVGNALNQDDHIRFERGDFL